MGLPHQLGLRMSPRGLWANGGIWGRWWTFRGGASGKKAGSLEKGFCPTHLSFIFCHRGSISVHRILPAMSVLHCQERTKLLGLQTMGWSLKLVAQDKPSLFLSLLIPQVFWHSDQELADTGPVALVLWIGKCDSGHWVDITVLSLTRTDLKLSLNMSAAVLNHKCVSITCLWS